MTDVRDAASGDIAEQRGPNPHGSFIWYELMTTDPEGAKAFYDSVVGWNIGARPPGDMDYRMIGRSDGGNAGGVLGLTEQMQQGGAHPLWIGYVGVDDVDASAAKFQAAGGQLLMSRDVPGVGRIAMVLDPQGNPLYLMKPTPPQGDSNQASDVFSPTAEQRVGWNELMTKDPEAARQFYGDAFGWSSDDFMPMGENGEYRFFAHHGTTFGAVCREMGSGNSKWRYYLRVPSISKAVEAVKAGGGQVSMGPHEVPGGDSIIIGNDPQGAEFALLGKA